MKNYKILLFVIILVLGSQISAQWKKINETDFGATGKIASNGNSVFVYGYQSGYKLFRTDDNGTMWNDLSSKAAAEFTCLYGYKGELFAADIGDVYVSTDNGESWTNRSSVSIPGGAIYGFTSDGDNLFLYSNRDKIFKSTDAGKTWSESSITYGDGSAQILMLDFAAVGNTWVATAVNAGAFVSKDGGATWDLKNPANIIGNVSSSGGKIFGTTIGTYKLNESAEWEAINNGLPQSSSMKSIIAYNGVLFGYAFTIFNGYIYSSTDMGNSWNETASDLPAYLTTTLNDFITVTPNGVFCYLYGLSIFAPGMTGTYTASINLTNIKKENEILPERFSLGQNFPNPFNPTTKISFTIPNRSNVNLKVYNLLGAEVATLVNEELNSGKYSVDFNASNLASGVYVYTIRANDFSQTRKMLLVK